jgi:hypothetical protein
VDVDPATNMRGFPVQHGAGDALLVFSHDQVIAGRPPHLRFGAGVAPAGSRPERGAGFLRVAIIAARAGGTQSDMFSYLVKDKRVILKGLLPSASLFYWNNLLQSSKQAQVFVPFAG